MGASEPIAAATTASGEDAVVVQLEGAAHLEAVAGAAADERHAGAEHRVRAAHDLLLVAAEAVGEEQQGAMRRVGQRRDGGRGSSAGAAQVGRGVLCDGRC